MSDTPHVRSARSSAKTAAVLRPVGALLCVSGVALMVGSEAYVLLKWTEVKQAQLAACVASSEPGVPFYSVVTGPRPDLCIAPAVLALPIIGVRVLLGKSPGIAPPAAALLLIGGALVTEMGFSPPQAAAF